MGKGFALRRRPESEKTAAMKMGDKQNAFLSASCLVVGKDPRVVLRHIATVQKALDDLEEAADQALEEQGDAGNENKQ